MIYYLTCFIYFIKVVISIVSLFAYLFHMYFNLVTGRLWPDFQQAPHYKVLYLLGGGSDQRTAIIVI